MLKRTLKDSDAALNVLDNENVVLKQTLEDSDAMLSQLDNVKAELENECDDLYHTLETEREVWQNKERGYNLARFEVEDELRRLKEQWDMTIEGEHHKHLQILNKMEEEQRRQKIQTGIWLLERTFTRNIMLQDTIMINVALRCWHSSCQTHSALSPAASRASDPDLFVLAHKSSNRRTEPACGCVQC